MQLLGTFALATATPIAPSRRKNRPSPIGMLLLFWETQKPLRHANDDLFDRETWTPYRAQLALLNIFPCSTIDTEKEHLGINSG